MREYGDIRGFNYQPGYGNTSAENWDRFDKSVWEKDLDAGKKYFPAMNAVRYWLSWDSYFRRPNEFLKNFDAALEAARKRGLSVIPCLLNRWHDENGYDNGGVSIENILFEESTAYYRPLYKKYLEDIARTFRGDSRILLWDICNEPFTSCRFTEKNRFWIEGERDWLRECCEIVRKADPEKRVGVSLAPELRQTELIDFTDVWLMHPYFFCTAENLYDPAARQSYEDFIDCMLGMCDKTGKPLLVTETCWGALQDDVRAEIVRFTLDTLQKRGVGFLVHALAYSRVADLHDSEDGFVGAPGNLSFLNKDGTLRRGHDVFNEFCPNRTKQQKPRL